MLARRPESPNYVCVAMRAPPPLFCFAEVHHPSEFAAVAYDRAPRIRRLRSLSPLFAAPLPQAIRRPCVAQFITALGPCHRVLKDVNEMCARVVKRGKISESRLRPRLRGATRRSDPGAARCSSGLLRCARNDVKKGWRTFFAEAANPVITAWSIRKAKLPPSPAPDGNFH